MNAMNSPGILKTLTMVTGLVVAGEVLARLTGMHLLSKGHNPWISWKNDLLLGLDLLVGIGLVVVVLGTRDLAGALPLHLPAGLGLLTHLYREWEYLVGANCAYCAGNAFCANQPLFVLNNVKLLGLLAVLVLTLAAAPWSAQQVGSTRNKP